MEWGLKGTKKTIRKIFAEGPKIFIGGDLSFSTPPLWLILCFSKWHY